MNASEPVHRTPFPRLAQPTHTLNSSQRWQAITKRDPTINDFVYAVRTTKIYCRPCCPARLARRANVQFFDTAAQAETAGFRACKRCRPQAEGTALANHPQTAFVDQACETIRAQLAVGLKPRLQDLAAQAGLTASHFHRVFKKRVGVTPGQYMSGLVQWDSWSGSDSATRLSSVSASRSDGEVLLREMPEEICSENSSVGGMNGRWPGPILLGSMEGTHLPEVHQDCFLTADAVWNDFDAVLALEAEPEAEPKTPSMATLDLDLPGLD
ncbi:hypothetical protein N7539_000493 [Penicillium diatomitis]|uniref:HTH araC/xylS-type domain-containing protein n=1 Tax=Penicillium diatomitis TaxID=2819901 RepID=A0A9W9XLS9_9EURO|nr:uncharacterized protein N7539_000493 [Penicillium diatomitis]KAJ5495377.1 hypothetical protein N7539_000493 [Penicillium diatomitis]